MVKIRIAVAVLIAAIAAPAFSAETAPSTVPATEAAPLPPRNPSDPKTAVTEFLNAVHTGDQTTIVATLYVAPESRPSVDTFLNLIFATSKLQKAALDKFGPSGEKYFGTAAMNQLESRLKAIQDAPVKTVGDSALITLPADDTNKLSGGTILLKKAGASWQIDAASLFNLNSLDKSQVEPRVALAAKLIPITDQTTAKINHGDYSAAVEAYQDFWSKSLDALKSVGMPSASEPATAPH